MGASGPVTEDAGGGNENGGRFRANIRPPLDKGGVASDEGMVKDRNQPLPSPCPCHIIKSDGGAGVNLQAGEPPQG